MCPPKMRTLALLLVLALVSRSCADDTPLPEARESMIESVFNDALQHDGVKDDAMSATLDLEEAPADSGLSDMSEENLYESWKEADEKLWKGFDSDISNKLGSAAKSASALDESGQPLLSAVESFEGKLKLKASALSDEVPDSTTSGVLSLQADMPSGVWKAKDLEKSHVNTEWVDSTPSDGPSLKEFTDELKGGSPATPPNPTTTPASIIGVKTDESNALTDNTSDGSDEGASLSPLSHSVIPANTKSEDSQKADKSLDDDMKHIQSKLAKASSRMAEAKAASGGGFDGNADALVRGLDPKDLIGTAGGLDALDAVSSDSDMSEKTSSSAEEKAGDDMAKTTAKAVSGVTTELNEMKALNSDDKKDPAMHLDEEDVSAMDMHVSGPLDPPAAKADEGNDVVKAVHDKEFQVDTKETNDMLASLSAPVKEVNVADVFNNADGPSTSGLLDDMAKEQEDAMDKSKSDEAALDAKEDANKSLDDGHDSGLSASATPASDDMDDPSQSTISGGEDDSATASPESSNASSSSDLGEVSGGDTSSADAGDVLPGVADLDLEEKPQPEIVDSPSTSGNKDDESGTASGGAPSKDADESTEDAVPVTESAADGSVAAAPKSPEEAKADPVSSAKGTSSDSDHAVDAKSTSDDKGKSDKSDSSEAMGSTDGAAQSSPKGAGVTEDVAAQTEQSAALSQVAASVNKEISQMESQMDGDSSSATVSPPGSATQKSSMPDLKAADKPNPVTTLQPPATPGVQDPSKTSSKVQSATPAASSQASAPTTDKDEEVAVAAAMGPAADISNSNTAAIEHATKDAGGDGDRVEKLGNWKDEKINAMFSGNKKAQKSVSEVASESSSELGEKEEGPWDAVEKAAGSSTSSDSKDVTQEEPKTPGESAKEAAGVVKTGHGGTAEKSHRDVIDGDAKKTRKETHEVHIDDPGIDVGAADEEDDDEHGSDDSAKSPKQGDVTSDNASSGDGATSGAALDISNGGESTRKKAELNAYNAAVSEMKEFKEKNNGHLPRAAEISVSNAGKDGVSLKLDQKLEDEGLLPVDKTSGNNFEFENDLQDVAKHPVDLMSLSHWKADTEQKAELADNEQYEIVRESDLMGGDVNDMSKGKGTTSAKASNELVESLPASTDGGQDSDDKSDDGSAPNERDGKGDAADSSDDTTSSSLPPSTSAKQSATKPSEGGADKSSAEIDAMVSTLQGNDDSQVAPSTVTELGEGGGNQTANAAFGGSSSYAAPKASAGSNSTSQVADLSETDLHEDGNNDEASLVDADVDAVTFGHSKDAAGVDPDSSVLDSDPEAAAAMKQEDELANPSDSDPEKSDDYLEAEDGASAGPDSPTDVVSEEASAAAKRVRAKQSHKKGHESSHSHKHGHHGKRRHEDGDDGESDMHESRTHAKSRKHHHHHKYKKHHHHGRHQKALRGGHTRHKAKMGESEHDRKVHSAKKHWDDSFSDLAEVPKKKATKSKNGSKDKLTGMAALEAAVRNNPDVSKLVQKGDDALKLHLGIDDFKIDTKTTVSDPRKNDKKSAGHKGGDNGETGAGDVESTEHHPIKRHHAVKHQRAGHNANQHRHHKNNGHRGSASHAHDKSHSDSGHVSEEMLREKEKKLFDFGKLDDFGKSADKDGDMEKESTKKLLSKLRGSGLDDSMADEIESTLDEGKELAGEGDSSDDGASDDAAAASILGNPSAAAHAKVKKDKTGMMLPMPSLSTASFSMPKQE